MRPLNGHNNIDSSLGKGYHNDYLSGELIVAVGDSPANAIALLVAKRKLHLAQLSTQRSIIDTWVGTAGLLLTVGTSIALLTIIPSVIQIATTASEALINIANSPGACAVLAVFALGIMLAARKQCPQFFATINHQVVPKPVQAVEATV